MARINKILVPIDFSEFSRHAFDRAVAIARCYRASVRALHIAWDPFAERFMPYVGPDGLKPVAWPRLDVARLDRDLRAFVPSTSVGVPVDYKVVEAPAVHEEILVQAKYLGADLIVMGTHGRSGFQRLVLGSVAEKVLRKADQPVLTVPRDAANTVPVVPPVFRSILCATDFSTCATAALEYAGALAVSAGARLTVIHVVELASLQYDPLLTPPVELPNLGASLHAFEKVGCTLLDRTIHETVPDIALERVVTSGRAYKEIMRVAAERDCDLIVLGIHGRNPLDRLMFGSTAEPIVRRATCPVLTIRPPDEAAAAAA